MAFEPGRGRTAVPVRSALAGSVVAVAALVAAAGLRRQPVGLVGTPHAVRAELGRRAGPRLRRRPGRARRAGVAGGARRRRVRGGQLRPAHHRRRRSCPRSASTQVRGGGYLTLLAGRAPAAAGRDRARRADAARRPRARSARPSGSPSTRRRRGLARPCSARCASSASAVLPAFSRGTFSPHRPGHRRRRRRRAAVRAVDAADPAARRQAATCYNFFLLRYRPGADSGRRGGTADGAVDAAGCPVGSCTVTADQRPGDIKDYAGVRDTPLVLAAVLAVLAVGTLAHVLLTGVRRRRRDLARAQDPRLHPAPGAAAWWPGRPPRWPPSRCSSGCRSASSPAAGPGRFFANAAGVAARPTVPLPLVLLAIPVTLLLANLIAAWPGWTAARLRPALVLANGVAPARPLPVRAGRNVVDVTSTTKECAGCRIDHRTGSAVAVGRRALPFRIRDLCYSERRMAAAGRRDTDLAGGSATRAAASRVAGIIHRTGSGVTAPAAGPPGWRTAARPSGRRDAERDADDQGGGGHGGGLPERDRAQVAADMPRTFSSAKSRRLRRADARMNWASTPGRAPRARRPGPRGWRRWRRSCSPCSGAGR